MYIHTYANILHTYKHMFIEIQLIYIYIILKFTYRKCSTGWLCLVSQKCFKTSRGQGQLAVGSRSIRNRIATSRCQTTWHAPRGTFGLRSSLYIRALAVERFSRTFVSSFVDICWGLKWRDEVICKTSYNSTVDFCSDALGQPPPTSFHNISSVLKPEKSLQGEGR